MKAQYDFSKAKRGSIVPNKGKTRISIFIDNAILDVFRTRAAAVGSGYQTMMNEALKHFLAQEEAPVTEAQLQQVVREEIPQYLRSLSSDGSGRRAKRGAS
jgi:hypothetical protein